MAKAAPKKKASSAHRKVLSSTAHSRRNVKRTNNKKTTGQKVDDKSTKQLVELPEAEPVKEQLVELPEVEPVKEQSVELPEAEPAKTPEIILHSSKRVDLLEREIAQTVESIVPSKQEVKIAVAPVLIEPETDKKDVEEALKDVIGRQEEVAQTVEVHLAATQKEKAIQEAIDEVKKSTTQKSKKSTVHHKKSRGRVHFGFYRVVLALACAAAAVFAIVYFVNQSTPNISLKVAAMQSGIDAKYPSYVPRDYSLSDITSEDGKITLNFRNSSTNEAFTLIEEKSSWDSSALVANYVKGTYGDDYSQVVEQGLTLFISGSDACWVNGGTVYKLKTTSGSLTKKQIKAIAVSL